MATDSSLKDELQGVTNAGFPRCVIPNEKERHWAPGSGAREIDNQRPWNPSEGRDFEV
jgi:hypothetical protein